MAPKRQAPKPKKHEKPIKAKLGKNKARQARCPKAPAKLNGLRTSKTGSKAPKLTLTATKKALLPPRPKNAPHAFALFVQEFAQTERGKQQHGPDRIDAAAREWKNMELEEKKAYTQRAVPAQEDFREKFELLKAKRQLLAKPPNGFALFVRAVYNDKAARSAGPKGFTNMTNHIAEQWKKMSDELKANYNDQAQQLQEAYKEMLGAIKEGKTLDEFLEEQEQ